MFHKSFESVHNKQVSNNFVSGKLVFQRNGLLGNEFQFPMPPWFVAKIDFFSLSACGKRKVCTQSFVSRNYFR